MDIGFMEGYRWIEWISGWTDGQLNGGSMNGWEDEWMGERQVNGWVNDR